jgi:hypothetical protein
MPISERPTPSSRDAATSSDVGDDVAARGSASFLAQFGKSEESTEWHSPAPPGYQRGRTKYVVVIGTVMSGLGKGIFSSSLAKLIQDKGLSVAPIKMEGYLNIDSGTLNPYRHGEVFVLADGMETDMDLGTYERVLNQDLSARNFVTAGQVYTEVLERERRGAYLGRDVQMIPHVTGAVKMRLRELAMTGGGPGGAGGAAKPARLRGGPRVDVLRRPDVHHRAADPGRAEEQGRAARHQAADGSGHPATHRRVSRPQPGDADGHGEDRDVQQRAAAARLLHA